MLDQIFMMKKFQHTAARRRLVIENCSICIFNIVSTHSRPKAAGASLKSLAPSGFAAPISLSSQEKREREYNTAFSVTPAFAIILIVKEQFQFSNPAAFS